MPDELGIALEEENKRLREELEAMRRLLLMCVACVRGVCEWSRCSPLHLAAPLLRPCWPNLPQRARASARRGPSALAADLGHDVRHLARSRECGLLARPAPLPTAAPPAMR